MRAGVWPGQIEKLEKRGLLRPVQVVRRSAVTLGTFAKNKSLDLGTKWGGAMGFAGGGLHEFSMRIADVLDLDPDMLELPTVGLPAGWLGFQVLCLRRLAGLQ